MRREGEGGSRVVERGKRFPLGNPRFPEASADVNSKRE